MTPGLNELRAHIITANAPPATLGLARLIVTAAHDRDVTLSLLCAVVDIESGFRNVFGHDFVANPIKSPPRGVLLVTKSRYLTYRWHRDQGEGQQGVGVTQLTDRGLQDQADDLGGCWRMSAQLDVAARLLASLIREFGEERGLAAYNAGRTGWRNGLDYAAKAERAKRAWHERLTR